jgi:hypothetical protein
VAAVDPNGATFNYDWTDYTEATDPDFVTSSNDLTVNCDPPPGSPFPLTPVGGAPTTVTCVAEDGAGNKSDPDFTFTVEVKDQQGPVFNPTTQPAVTLEAESPNGKIYTITKPVATDNVSGPSDITVACFDKNQPTTAIGDNHPFAFGDTTVACTATDAAGNQNAAANNFEFTVTVVDNTDPVFVTSTLPQDLADQQANSPGGLEITFTPPTATDLGQTLMAICNVSSTYTFPLGITTVGCTADDTRGNTATTPSPWRSWTPWPLRCQLCQISPTKKHRLRAASL